MPTIAEARPQESNQPRADQYAAGVHEPATPPRRLDYLDGLRALAALYVLLDHVFVNCYPVYWDANVFRSFLALPWAPLGSCLLFARYAVDLFIVLSGFCLMLPVVKAGGKLSGGAIRFYIKRCRRILPPYYAALILCALVTWCWALEPITTRAVWTHALLVNDWTHNDVINGAFWSIAVECHIYLLFPLFVLASTRWGVIRAAAAAIVIGAGVYFAGYGRIPWEVSPHFIGLFSMGAAGAAIAYSADDRMAHLRERLPWRALAGGMAVVLVAIKAWKRLANWHGLPIAGGMDIVAGLTAAAIMIAASRPGRNLLRSCLEWRPLVAIGGFSYSLYLIHGPIIRVVHDHTTIVHLSPLLALLTLILVVTPLVIAIAYLFHRMFERPFLTAPRPASVWARAEAALAGLWSTATRRIRSRQWINPAA